MSTLAMLNGWQARFDELCERLDTLNANLERGFPANDQEHSRGYREWERFVLIDGATTSGTGAATVGGAGSHLRPCAVGWEAYVTSVAVSVGGASSAATVVNYNGEAADANLFDYANAILGSSPSRIIGFYDPETVYAEPDTALTIVVAGAVASQQVTVRVCGKRRQL